MRKYDIPDLVWDGVEGCEHEWINDPVPGAKSGKPGPNACVGLQYGDAVRRREPTNTCGRCGTWRGQLGLEPTIELYLSHLLEVTKEIWRVLRKDGVFFVNIGDSYAGSGKGIGSDHGKAVFTDDDIPRIEKFVPKESESSTHSPYLDAWAAGFFDGEGNIGIAPTNKAGQMRLIVGQVKKEPLEKLQSLYGGSLRVQQSRKNNWANYWVWQLQSQKASDALSLMLPYLTVKKQQAHLAIGFQSTIQAEYGKRNKLSPELIETRRKIAEEIKKLNQVGISEPEELEGKQLCLIPFRLALELQAQGWWVRSDIIWAKSNPMPESVKDRPTRSHEYIFMLTKSAKYFWDAEAVKEGAQDWGTRDRTGQKVFTEGVMPNGQPHRGCTDINFAKRGRNIRSVWTIATQPFSGAHYAVFPEELVERCIKAGCPKDGIVLDPFAGSGTVQRVAEKLNRIGIGFDLGYENLREKRLKNNQKEIWV